MDIKHNSKDEKEKESEAYSYRNQKILSMAHYLLPFQVGNKTKLGNFKYCRDVREEHSCPTKRGFAHETKHTNTL